jgi:hypothetical protein
MTAAALTIVLRGVRDDQRGLDGVSQTDQSI